MNGKTFFYLIKIVTKESLVIPNNETLNPFIHTDEEIEKHLDFEDDMIIGLSEIGLKTIQKYHLDKPTFNYLRSKELIKFYKLLSELNNNKISRDNLLLLLISFSNTDRPFSLMIRKILKKHNF
jgi:hypothetical protein